MRPTKKEIMKSAVNATVQSDNESNHEKVKRLMAAGHNCLSCTYFDVSPINMMAKCRNKRRSPVPIYTKWYNICHVHSAPLPKTVPPATTTETKETI